MKNTPRKPERVREKRSPYARARRAKAPEPVVLLGKPVPHDVLQFCERQGILEYLRLADELIARHFPDASALDVEMHEDPETGDEAVLLRLLVSGNLDDLLQRSQRYTNDWVAQVPWPQREKISITYDITER